MQHKKILVSNSLSDTVDEMDYQQFTYLKNKGGYPNLHFQKFVDPADVFPCWYISEEEKNRVLLTGKSFDRSETSEYFRITNRIDNRHIEGILGRKDRELEFINDYRDRLTYLLNYQDRKKVYFTFDSINLYEVVEIFTNYPQPIKFILKRLDAQVFKPGQAFMIMPFKIPELHSFYVEQIKRFLSDRLNITIYRADDILDNDFIVNTIYTMIEESEIIIADTTFENKNAFYELGYASAIGKEIICIEQERKERKLFFDRAHIRTILYEQDKIDAFHFQLQATIESIRQRLSQ